MSDATNVCRTCAGTLERKGSEGGWVRWVCPECGYEVVRPPDPAWGKKRETQ